MKISKKILLTCIASLMIVFLIIIKNIPTTYSSPYGEIGITKNPPMIGGSSMTLNYNTNGGNSIPSNSYCYVCGITDFATLPVPQKTNYMFEGWYNDKELTKKLTNTNTKSIIPTKKYDSNGCETGYNDVILYAKWLTNKTISLSGVLRDDNGK